MVLCLSVVYLSECPGELHVFGGCVAALQQPRSAVHIHQTLVVIIVNRWTQYSQVKLLRACIVDILLENRNRDSGGRTFSNMSDEDPQEPLFSLSGWEEDPFIFSYGETSKCQSVLLCFCENFLFFLFLRGHFFCLHWIVDSGESDWNVGRKRDITCKKGCKLESNQWSWGFATTTKKANKAAVTLMSLNLIYMQVYVSTIKQSKEELGTTQIMYCFFPWCIQSL